MAHKHNFWNQNSPWLIPTITGVAGLALGISIGTVGLSSAKSIFDRIEAQKDTEIFSKAIQACEIDTRYAIVSDGGRTLTMDQEGQDDYGGVSIQDISCLANELNVPHSVLSHMSQTRALDGRQTETWDNFEISWIYHPDSGMDSIWKVLKNR